MSDTCVGKELAIGTRLVVIRHGYRHHGIRGSCARAQTTYERSSTSQVGSPSCTRDDDATKPKWNGSHRTHLLF
jgi:hypothetical protein